jgi:5-methylcytosine-specific restriction endonuclease McrA
MACRRLFDMDSTGTLRCPDCQAAATARRNARPSSSARGLGWKFSERKKNDANYQQATTCQCRGCTQHSGVCGEPFTAANPKTADHTVPRSQGGGDGPITAMCRRCNSARGGQLAHGGR